MKLQNKAVVAALSALLILSATLLAGGHAARVSVDAAMAAGFYSAVDPSGASSAPSGSGAPGSASSDSGGASSSKAGASSSSKSSSSKSASSKTASSAASSSKPAASSVPPPVAPPSDEMRAVWISYLEYQSILQGRSSGDFRASVESYFNNCVSLGLNTVIVQARSHGDAYYNSSLFPTAKYFTGTRGAAAGFDPLAIMVEAAHARGLKIEAWINPYRGPATSVPLAEGEIFAQWQGTDKVITSGGYYYLNPGESEVRDYITAGVREIAQNYAVDGIHFDDYFYPTADPAFDANTYANYGAGRNLAQFRLDSVSTLVSSVYSAVKAIRPIPFGISPAGNINNVYNTASADVRLWGGTPGYVDYLAPQIYWAFGEGSLPYENALETWKGVVTSSSVKLVVGLAAYKVGNGGDWNTGDALARQITAARAAANYKGFVMFRYQQLFSAACDRDRAAVKALF